MTLDTFTLGLLRRDQKRQKKDRRSRSIALSLATIRNIAASKPQRLIHIVATVALPVLAGATV
jgi:hypothetical protein